MRPAREKTRYSEATYFITSQTADRLPLFRHERWCALFLETILSYRPSIYQLHAFVIMPDHFHLLISPQVSLERAVQHVKGGFSFKAKREFKWNGGLWQAGFSDHRIRSAEDCQLHLGYILSNPVRAGLARSAEEFRWCSAGSSSETDEIPQRLKPHL